MIRAAVAVAIMMTAASIVSEALRPSSKIDKVPDDYLEQLAPRDFGDWRELPRSVAYIVSPQQRDLLNQIYDQTVSRTYVDAQGRAVMLSIAYGSLQSGRLKVHRPESCYSAQGFLVKSAGQDVVRTEAGMVGVKRLVAISGARNEPITYWIRVGDATATGLFAQRVIQLKFAALGEVPDGLIFRVSSIGSSPEVEYELHDLFIKQLIASRAGEQAVFLIGRGSK